MRELGVCLLPENANELDAKEINYIIGYLNQQFAEVLDQYLEYKRLPIFVLSAYGDCHGKTSVIVNPSRDREIATNWRLPELVEALKITIDKWDESLDSPPKEKGDMTAYQAIQAHLKKDK